MSRVIIYFDFKMSGHNLARFQNSLKNSLGTLEYILLWDEFFFLNSLKTVEKRVKITYNKLGYVSLVGWVVRFYPIFYRILGKKAKDRDKDWMWHIRMYSTHRMNTQILPHFPEFTQETENRGEDWLWKAMMYPTCGINCKI